ncbi:MAG: RtcB family protein [Candidatus Poseidoniaceae archaeon]|jgi:tRNA-splicing ligase RtcB|nr:RtcB family protein [Candidatus Poseidoniaceae archaeon]
MGEAGWREHLTMLGDGLAKISKHGSMNVDAMVVTDENHLASNSDERSLSQLVNIASMPGVVGNAWAMADWHYGYGFPIGGVLATDVEWGEQGGSISPGGVGFDINCGVRLIAFDCMADDIPNLRKLAGRLNGRIPSGGSGKGGVKLTESELDDVVLRGADAALDLGLANDNDLENIESNGTLFTEGNISERAKKRGMRALGTLGSGNHFLELQVVDRVEESNQHNLHEGQLVCMIHSGSRGLGHQVCTDHVRDLESRYKARNGLWYDDEWGFEIQDRQLAAAPIHSRQGESYLDAMNAAANYAFANRSALTSRLRKAVSTEIDVESRLVYDVSHNIAKIETHTIHGSSCKCCVHRKGATRAKSNQPVMVPGDMGTASWLLEGMAGNSAFESSCHGAGRLLSRSQAKREIDGEMVKSELNKRGIEVHANTPNILSEEAPGAYKDVDEVIRLTNSAGLAKPIARFTPLAVIKG